jgi:hypothetical protein
MKSITSDSFDPISCLLADQNIQLSPIMGAKVFFCI